MLAIDVKDAPFTDAVGQLNLAGLYFCSGIFVGEHPFFVLHALHSTGGKQLYRSTYAHRFSVDVHAFVLLPLIILHTLQQRS